MAGGGTWTILVKEGAAKGPTQSNLTGGQPSKLKKAIQDGNKQRKEISQRNKQVVALGVTVAGIGINQYYSITGQQARRNLVNAGFTYGLLGARIAGQLLTFNPAGAAITAAAAGIALGTQYFNFQRDITESNANAEYLRQRSNTSLNNGKDLYRFSLN